MKLSTANLSQKLQKIKPLEQLSGKLKQVAKPGPHQRGSTSSAPKIKSVPKGGIKEDAAKPLSIVGNSSKPEVTVEKPASAETSSASKGGAGKAHAAVVPGFIKNSKLVKNSKSARVAFHLLLVKPWVLVVGLWLVSALSAVVALEGMISPKRLTKDLPEPTVAVTPTAKTNNFIDVEQGAEGITNDGTEAEAGQPETTDVVSSGPSVPIWPLVTLVGSCAAGCVVMSRRRAMLQMAAARNRKRSRKPHTAKSKTASARIKASDSKVTRKTAASANKKASVAAFKSMARSADKAIEKSSSKAATTREKKRRQRKRPSSQPLSTQSSGKKRVLVSRSNAQKAAPQSRVSQPKKPQRTRQKVARLVRRQPVVSVVPANHSNRLDWVDGSLAHDMDRRFAMRDDSTQQKRAAM